MFYSLPPAGNKIPIKAIARAIKDSRRSWWDQFESIKGLLPAKYLLYLSSGRAALWLLLKALSHIRPDKQEVIIPAYTCPAVASAILKAGLKPVLCDINLNDFGFKTENLKLKIGNDTLAVIVVHLFGYPANLEEVKECCRKFDIYVIEDAAQAFGNSLLNSPENKLGLLADAGFFSFGRGKPLSLGHGGLLVMKSDETAAEVTRLFEDMKQQNGHTNLKYLFKLGSYSIFSNPYLYWIPQNIPSLHLGETVFEPEFEISGGVDLAASLITNFLPSIEKEKENRQENTVYYSDGLDGIPEIKKVPFPEFPYLRYPLVLKDNRLRDQVLTQLVRQGTGAALFYPTPLNELPGLEEVLGDRNVYPNAKKLSDGLITLPVHSRVTPSHREKIIKLIKNSVYCK